ncbi:helix-turn-helix domain-containing protein [Chryseobacterium turcicum]|uniref:Helix-turn-helix transcriptional regulator n=1 Tax=Chryseobacterium turcicum TaxID=2898076 RepID=A0A9Q3YW49_9FLAO|nr:helix-turn-helix transcriptional regulator [Chryseobacterium turcicum]MCD1117598.1 helix-turn-helix transcriptional regulator [Chryseobacterium turcicum]
MKNQHLFNSVSEYHTAMNLKKPTNPLISVVRLEDVCPEFGVEMTEIVFNFYTIFLKRDFDGKVKYGQKYYDFDDGTMSFFAPKQKVSLEGTPPSNVNGWMLVIHPDFLHGYPLAKKIKDYGFFDYATHEALHLSEAEDDIIGGLMESLQREITDKIDNHSQDVLVGYIDLLLSYCNRFYTRQFITRKKVSNDLLVKFETILKEYYSEEKAVTAGLPTVHYFADQLFVSTNYLNDMLKNLTGQTTQQHIQNQLLEKAKEFLSTTELSISEIAYQLGFEYPQSFSKLFKNKTQLTPLKFRQSYN